MTYINDEEKNYWINRASSTNSILTAAADKMLLIQTKAETDIEFYSIYDEKSLECTEARKRLKYAISMLNEIYEIRDYPILLTILTASEEEMNKMINSNKSIYYKLIQEAKSKEKKLKEYLFGLDSKAELIMEQYKKGIAKETLIPILQDYKNHRITTESDLETIKNQLKFYDEVLRKQSTPEEYRQLLLYEFTGESSPVSISSMLSRKFTYNKDELKQLCTKMSYNAYEEGLKIRKTILGVSRTL